MTLVRDAAHPELWRNDAWNEEEPGTFAVVIGVSRYRHLDGSARSYGLSSLYSSALTAHYVFRWLADHYQGPEIQAGHTRRVARVWYLVSPTPAEIDIEPELGEAPVEPTLDGCAAAIAQWDAAIRALSPAAARDSTAVFFFSGHGFEALQDEQLLLPADYLEPPTRNVNTAISTRHLSLGLSDVALNEQLFFVDACRNDMDALRRMNPRGETILNQPGPDQVNAARMAAICHATSSGHQAFQPRDPSDGASIFGQALLEGLRGLPDIELHCDGGRCSVNLLALNAFLKRRVPELLEERSATVGQPVSMSMTNVADYPIALVPASSVVRGDGVPKIGTKSAEALSTARLSLDAMGVAESLSQVLWDGAEFFDMEGGSLGSPEAYAVLHHASEDEVGRSVRIEFSPREPGRCWLRIPHGDGAVGFLLPADPSQPPVFRLDMAVERDGSGGRPGVLPAVMDLALTGQMPLGYAAELWATFRDDDPGAVLEQVDFDLLEELMREKFQSPLAASVAGTVLLRTGQLGRLHDWARNLANFFPAWPEGPVLWAKQLEEQAGEVRRWGRDRTSFEVRGREDPLRWVAELDRRGLPALSELVSILSVVLETHAGRIDGLGGEEGEAVARVRDRLRAALRLFRPGGLFAAFASEDPEEVTPKLVQW